MYAIGFDNNKYVSLQSERIRRRIGELGGKLYLEFGGKLFDDYHASRVLPGFRPDSKIRMLLEMKDEAEIIVVISADDVERNKRRGDLGITYDMEALRLIDAFRASGLYVGGVCITHCREGSAASPFEKRLASLGLPVYRQYLIPNYPADLPLIAIGTLDTLVAQAVDDGLVPEGCKYIIPMIDARRMEVYTAVFSPDGKQLTETAPVIVDETTFADRLAEGPVLFVGDGALKCEEVISGRAPAGDCGAGDGLRGAFPDGSKTPRTSNRSISSNSSPPSARKNSSKGFSSDNCGERRGPCPAR